MTYYWPTGGLLSFGSGPTQTDYYQFVDINSVFTMHTKVKFGIRKGLELDSLLFIFATSKLLINNNFHSYANEIQLHVTSKPNDRHRH